MTEGSCRTLLLLLPRCNHISSLQGTRYPPLCCPSNEAAFHRATHGHSSSPPHVWRSYQRDFNRSKLVHYILRSDFESFLREGWMLSRDEQPGCQLRANWVGKIRYLSDLSSFFGITSVEELACQYTSDSHAVESCMDKWHRSKPHRFVLCFVTFTHIHFPTAGCWVVYLQLPNYQSALLVFYHRWGNEDIWLLW